MTTLEQKQQAADGYSVDSYSTFMDRQRAFIAGAEWAEAQQGWIHGSEGKPFPNGCDRDHVDCWIVRKGKLYSELAAWNDHHQMWDKPDYDDSLCDHDDVLWYLPIKLPPIPLTQQEEGKYDRIIVKQPTDHGPTP